MIFFCACCTEILYTSEGVKIPNQQQLQQIQYMHTPLLSVWVLNSVSSSLLLKRLIKHDSVCLNYPALFDELGK